MTLARWEFLFLQKSAKEPVLGCLVIMTHDLWQKGARVFHSSEGPRGPVAEAEGEWGWPCGRSGAEHGHGK